jgi:hypothetical protein
MTAFKSLREKVYGTSALLNYTISQCEISANDKNINDFNQAIENTEMLLNEVRRHVNELNFLGKLQNIKAGSKLVQSLVTKKWFLMRNETIVETDFAIPDELIDNLKAKYKFIPTAGSNHFFMYELIKKAE